MGNFDIDTPTAELYQILADKCNLLKGRYPNIEVEGHRKYATYKSCPGNNFKIEEVVKRMEKEATPVITLKGEDFDADAKVVFKGKEIQAGIVTLLEGGKTFIEIRAVAELLGLKVAYDNSTKTVTLS